MCIFYLPSLNLKADRMPDRSISSLLPLFRLAVSLLLYPREKNPLRASLGTLIFHGIFIFPKENELISLGKMKIPREISVPKLALTKN